ncbi:hypothetical protein [Hyphomonas sp.]|jgi:hypothetical protein|uniref:hypothetical protein n=1 Tax=Hyphomonas sp. TaxID=87 RepID=UPI0025C406A1|nr:hypothetical protein [Hyphomonas sp.]
MARFFAIFSIVLILGVIMMSGILSRYGYSLADPEMRIMLGICLFVALYVAWRINGVLKARSLKLSDREAPGGAGQGKLAGLFAPRSKALAAREAQLAARRRKLVAEGKLAPEEAGPEPAPAPEPVPVPIATSPTNVKDRMAARRERVRKAREEGKLD